MAEPMSERNFVAYLGPVIAPISVYVERTGDTTWWVGIIVRGTDQRRTRHRTESAAMKAANKLRADLKG